MCGPPGDGFRRLSDLENQFGKKNIFQSPSSTKGGTCIVGPAGVLPSLRGEKIKVDAGDGFLFVAGASQLSPEERAVGEEGGGGGGVCQVLPLIDSGITYSSV